jgi:hypothetical protein
MHCPLLLLAAHQDPRLHEVSQVLGIQLIELLQPALMRPVVERTLRCVQPREGLASLSGELVANAAAFVDVTAQFLHSA